MTAFLVACAIVASVIAVGVFILMWYRFVGDEMEAAGKPRLFQIFFGPGALGLLALWWGRREQRREGRDLR